MSFRYSCLNAPAGPVQIDKFLFFLIILVSSIGIAPSNNPKHNDNNQSIMINFIFAYEQNFHFRIFKIFFNQFKIFFFKLLITSKSPLICTLVTNNFLGE